MLLTGGIVAAIVVVLALLLYKSPKDRAAQAESDRAFAASLASAAASAKAANESFFREHCKLKPNQEVFPADDDKVRDRCRDEVRDHRTVRGSVSFDDQSPEITTDDGCNRIVSSTFEGKNAFGVEVRNRYVCSYDPRFGLYGVRFP